VPINKTLHWSVAVIVNPGALYRQLDASEKANQTNQVCDQPAAPTIDTTASTDEAPAVVRSIAIDNNLDGDETESVPSDGGDDSSQEGGGEEGGIAATRGKIEGGGVGDEYDDESQAWQHEMNGVSDIDPGEYEDSQLVEDDKRKPGGGVDELVDLCSDDDTDTCAVVDPRRMQKSKGVGDNTWIKQTSSGQLLKNQGERVKSTSSSSSSSSSSSYSQSSFSDYRRIKIKQDNPRRHNSTHFEKYESVKVAKTIGEFLMLGGLTTDIQHYIQSGYLTLLDEPKRGAKSTSSSSSSSSSSKSSIYESRRIEIQQNNPKTPGSSFFDMFERLKVAKTVGEFLKLGGTKIGLEGYREDRYLTFLEEPTRAVSSNQNEGGAADDETEGSSNTSSPSPRPTAFLWEQAPPSQDVLGDGLDDTDEEDGAKEEKSLKTQSSTTPMAIDVEDSDGETGTRPYAAHNSWGAHKSQALSDEEGDDFEEWAESMIEGLNLGAFPALGGSEPFPCILFLDSLKAHDAKEVSELLT
jgi:hypothetical protein